MAFHDELDFANYEGCLRILDIVADPFRGQSQTMLDATSLFIAATFVLAGFVKGVVGLGLPTISMGLLAVVMPPVEAAAILVLPSLLTNLWQAFAGPCLGSVVRRLWPMMLGVCAGTWAGAGLITGADVGYGTALLGLTLVAYAASGLAARRLSIGRRHEPWIGPVAGAMTGLTTAATGVFVVPAVPYLGAIGLEKETLVQALGLSFTVSTLALAVNLACAHALEVSLARTAVGALLMAWLGMSMGQALRTRVQPATFRRWFFVGLLLLGAYLVLRAMV